MSHHEGTGRVVVVGSINMDLVALTERYPQLGETLQGKNLNYIPGGKGLNQGISAARSGAPTIMVSALGTDQFAPALRAHLEQDSIDLTYVTEVEGSSGIAMITLVENQDNAIIVIPGANASVTADALTDIELTSADVVVCQLEVPEKTVLSAFAQAKAAGATTVFNPSPAKTGIEEIIALTDFFIVNETELAWFATGDSANGSQDLDVVKKMAQDYVRPGQTILVSIGPAGVAIIDEGGLIHIPGRPANVVDTTGAGDTLAGALAAELSRGVPVPEAVRYGVFASSLATETFGAGTSMPIRERVITALVEADN